MSRARFTTNPFPGLELSAADKLQLEELSLAFIQENLVQYEQLLTEQHGKVDERRWKLAKTKEDMRVYAERPRREIERYSQSMSSGDEAELIASDLPAVLTHGTVVGQLEDLLFGVLNPTVNTMRVKASYVDDLSGAAVLCPVIEPTTEEPFRSLIIKWMELDLPLRQTNLVRNRDYVYMEATGLIKTSAGEHVGYHLLHSVDFPQAHPLPKRIRGMFSVCGFFRQVTPNCIEIWASGTVDPGGDLMRILLVPAAAAALLSCIKYVYCGQMKKLTWLLEKQYAERNSRSIGRREKMCVTCGKTNMVMGKAKCRLCFGYVCFSCKISKKLSFVTPDDELLQRKVVFCSACVSQAVRTSAVDAARAQIRGTASSLAAFRNTSSSDTASERSFDSCSSSVPRRQTGLIP